MSTDQQHKRQMSGFTLIEVLIISPIIVLMIGGVLALLVNLTSENLVSSAEIDLVHDSHTALGIVERDIRLASEFLTTEESAFSDPYGADNSGAPWSYKGSSSSSRVLLARTYATSKSVQDPNKTPVYISQYGCDDAVLPSNPSLTTNTIYFTKGDKLYRRILTDTSYMLCNPQHQQHSCPANVGVRPPICKTDDTLILSGVTNFDVQYYTDSGDTTPIAAYASNDPSILVNATTIDVSVSVSKFVAGEELVYSSTMKLSRLND